MTSGPRNTSKACIVQKISIALFASTSWLAALAPSHRNACFNRISYTNIVTIGNSLLTIACKARFSLHCYSTQAIVDMMWLSWFVCIQKRLEISGCKIHLFAGRAVERERRKGSSRRQQPAYGAAVNEVARELLRSARSLKRENGGRRYIKHDGMIASPVGSCLCCWQLPLSPPIPPLYCSASHCPSLSDQIWCIQRCDCVNCT